MMMHGLANVKGSSNVDQQFKIPNAAPPKLDTAHSPEQLPLTFVGLQSVTLKKQNSSKFLTSLQDTLP
jgi:hypothetical protein